MFQNIKISALPIVLFIQTIIIIMVYLPFFNEGEVVLFNNTFDGLKNYFTYYTYLFQGDEISNSMYNQMNYPFYEYIFYTDQTPTFALPIKWFSDNILDSLFLLKQLQDKVVHPIEFDILQYFP